MKRFLGLVVLMVLWASPAQAVSFEGGTAEQHAAVLTTIGECRVSAVSVESRLGDIRFVFKQMNYGGLALPGEVWLHEELEGDGLSYVAAHEWGHEIWYCCPDRARAEWFRLCGPGVDIWTGAISPVESFAENARINLWASPDPYLLTGLPIWERQAFYSWLRRALAPQAERVRW